MPDHQPSWYRAGRTHANAIIRDMSMRRILDEHVGTTHDRCGLQLVSVGEIVDDIDLEVVTL